MRRLHRRRARAKRFARRPVFLDNPAGTSPGDARRAPPAGKAHACDRGMCPDGDYADPIDWIAVME